MTEALKEFAGFIRSAALGATVLVSVGFGATTGAVGATERGLEAEVAHAIPAPATDEDPAAATTTETVVLAGGCFWGVQGVFQHVDGVINAVSGYAGGDKKSAIYEVVAAGRTGHAESGQ